MSTCYRYARVGIWAACAAGALSVATSELDAGWVTLGPEADLLKGGYGLTDCANAPSGIKCNWDPCTSADYKNGDACLMCPSTDATAQRICNGADTDRVNCSYTPSHPCPGSYMSGTCLSAACGTTTRVGDCTREVTQCTN
jgi:hypothetical protein